jgi:hypothetical protein
MEPDRIDQGIIDAVAALLAPQAASEGTVALGELKHLEPAALEALRSRFGARAAKSRRVEIPRWQAVGRVDLVVASPDASNTFSLLAELKWCGTKPILFEGVWDCFKMALGAGRPERPHAYLITGAHASVWETSAFADLFDTKDHDPVELCERDIGGRDHWLAWDALLYGGYDSYPEAVPAVLRTTVVARTPVADGEIRAVEVEAVGDEWIPFIDGWPHGNRPAQARRPAADPKARIVADPSRIDWDDDIQFDPAYDPANADLISQLREIGAWPDDYPKPTDYDDF